MGARETFLRGRKGRAAMPSAGMIAASKPAIFAFSTLLMISHVLTNLAYYNAKVLEALQTVLLPVDLALEGWAVCVLVAALAGIWRKFDPANSFNQPLNNWNVSKVESMVGMF